MAKNTYYRSPGTSNRLRYRRKKQLSKILLVIGSLLLLVVGYIVVSPHLSNAEETTSHTYLGKAKEASTLNSSYPKPVIQEKLLDPNPYSRPQKPLETVNGIVVHYVGNPDTSAEANRNYFNSLAKSQATYASSHYVIDLDGTIIQCIPLTEMSYASNDRNKDTISIEVCHPDASGKFTTASYNSLVNLTGWLCSKYNLNSDAVIRHYDVSGKRCPLYYVEHEDAWLNFKKDVYK